MPVSDYIWDTGTRRYRSLTTGRFTPPSEVRAEVDRVISYWEGEMKDASVQLVKQTMSLGEWQDFMVQGLKTLHLSAAAAANGGFANLDSADFTKVSAKLDQEFDYLQSFALELQNGDQPLNGMVVVRENLYVNAARNTYEDFNRDGHQESGDSLERNVLDPGVGHHCDDCLEATDQGWVPIGTLSLPGDRECQANDMCTLEYNRGDISEAEDNTGD